MATTFARPVSYGPSSAANPNEGRRYGGAFWVSATVHGVVIGLLLFFTLTLGERLEDKPKVFELVAGPGDDFMATDAPSGSEAGRAEQGEIQFTSPGPVPTWTPPAPEPDPAPPAPPAAPPPPPTRVAKVEPVKEPVTPPPAPVPNFTKSIKRTIAKADQKTQKELQKQRDADARAAKERELADKRLSYDEFSKGAGGKTSASQRATTSGGGGATGPRLDPGAVKRGVTGATGAGTKGAGGTALSAAEGERMERYFDMLISRLQESHEKPGGLSDLLNAEVTFTVAANGSISGVRIVRSSGNAEFDQSVLEAFGRVKMPARPDGKSDVQRLTFRIKEA